MPPNDGMDAGGILQAKHCIYTLLELGRVQKNKKDNNILPRAK